MYFLIKDDELLEKYFKIWDKVKRFNSESVYNEEHLKTKIKSCKGKITKNIHSDKVRINKKVRRKKEEKKNKQRKQKE